MPNRKISQLPQTSLPTTLEDTDRLPLARAGNTFHILGSDIKSPILSQAQSTMLTKVNSLSARDSATIDLSFSSASYALSADVRDNSITTSKIASEAVRYSQLASWQSLSASPTLSAEAVTQRVAKATGWFYYTGSTGLTAGPGFNFANVVRVKSDPYSSGYGIYQVTFISPMNSRNYIVLLNNAAGSSLDNQFMIGNGNVCIKSASTGADMFGLSATGFMIGMVREENFGQVQFTVYEN